jgi:hypothetical protein
LSTPQQSAQQVARIIFCFHKRIVGDTLKCLRNQYFQPNLLTDEQAQISAADRLHWGPAQTKASRHHGSRGGLRISPILSIELLQRSALINHHRTHNSEGRSILRQARVVLLRPMGDRRLNVSAQGHSRPARAESRSSHVRCALKPEVAGACNAFAGATLEKARVAVMARKVDRVPPCLPGSRTIKRWRRMPDGLDLV